MDPHKETERLKLKERETAAHPRPAMDAMFVLFVLLVLLLVVGGIRFIGDIYQLRQECAAMFAEVGYCLLMWK